MYNILKKQCVKYKAELTKQNEEISKYVNIIESYNREKEQKAFENKPINFKIVIGKDLSDDEINELNEKNLKIIELTTELEKNTKELVDFKQILSEKSEKFNKEIEVQVEKNIELTKKNKILEEQYQTFQENSIKYKSRIQKNIIECYNTLKLSFNTIGLKIPQIKAENLGQEDIQEFIYTQSKYIEDSMIALNTIIITYKKKSNSLEELKQILSEILNESAAMVKDATESSKNFDIVCQRALKEKENLHKILSKKDERIKILTDEIKQVLEDHKNFEEFKVDNAKLIQKIKTLTEGKDISDKLVEDLKRKLKKASDYMSNADDSNLNLNARIKVLNSNINDKENIIKSLQEKISTVNSEKEDIKSCLNEYKSTSERNLKEFNDLHNKNILEIQENAALQVSDIKSQLSKALNDAKDAGIAKIHSNKYQKAVENLQEIIKNLENQSTNNIQKIEKLILINEDNKILLKKKQEKIKKFKEEIQMLKNNIKSMQHEHRLEKDCLIAKAKESELIRCEAENLLKRIEIQIQASDSMIDKRLIATFLINYLDEKNNSKVKMQMLKALAEMLGLNKEQRIKIGLGHEGGLFSQFANYIVRS